jgi:hypothetical protein
LAIHSEAIRDDVARLHAGIQPRTFDAILRRHGKEIVMGQARRILADFYFCPEFPAKHYLFVDPGERQRRSHLLWGNDPLVGAKMIDARWCGTCPMGLEEMVREAQRTKGSIYRVGGFDLALLKINWTLPDSWLKENFAAWLEANRPKEIKPVPDRGEGVPARVWKNKLKKLAAWRLLRKVSWGEAADITHYAYGKPLYSEQAEWLKARKWVDTQIEEQEQFCAGFRMQGSNKVF